jgi:hypothetical protein
LRVVRSLPPASQPGNALRRWFWPSCILLIAVKLWLVDAGAIFALGSARHDDRLFLELAESLLRGQWLGAYNNLTLTKGPMYPIWVALSFLSSLPLFWSQHFLYASGCLLTVGAFSEHPRLGPPFLFAMFTVLLFNPVSFEGSVISRTVRQGFTASMALLAVAALAGFYLRRRRAPRSVALWGLLAGVCLGSFWLAREEGPWILPFVAGIYAGLTYFVLRDRSPDRWRRLAALALPVVVSVAMVASVALINGRTYGVYATVEIKAKPFLAAYGALARVQHEQFRPRVPVPGEVRTRIYAVSPAFSELRPFLEGRIGAAWAAPDAADARQPSGLPEIQGGWFIWALRDAVAAAGYHDRGDRAMRFYQRLADEVNAACERALLACGSERATLMPPWRSDYLPMVVATFWRACLFTVGFQGYTLVPPPSLGPAPLLQLFNDVTRSRLTPMAGSDEAAASQAASDAFKWRVLDAVHGLYATVTPWAAALALLMFVYDCFRYALTRRAGDMLLLEAAILASVLALIAVIALIDVTSFRAIDVGYLAPAYPLVLLLVVLNLRALAPRFPSLSAVRRRLA